MFTFTQHLLQMIREMFPKINLKVLQTNNNAVPNDKRSRKWNCYYF